MERIKRDSIQRFEKHTLGALGHLVCSAAVVEDGFRADRKDASEEWLWVGSLRAKGLGVV